MGRPKLLLPVAGKPVIAHLLEALQHPAIVARVVVTRLDDIELQALVRSAGGIAVVPETNPPDMRASIEIGLQSVRERWQPDEHDGWLMLPADHPQLSTATVAALIETWSSVRPRWLVPVCDGRRGHPLLARWETASLLESLPPDVGLNTLLRQHASEIMELVLPDEGILTDLDTPADYDRLLNQ